MTSIKAVANAAGVSVATVSRVLNGTKFVSPDVREKVLRAVQELNYQPDITARSLRRGRTQSIGVALPHLNDAFFSSLAFSLQKTLFANGYTPLFCSTEETALGENTVTQLLLSNRVDGVIFVPLIPTLHSQENIHTLTSQGIPVVLVDRGIADLPVSQVLCDNFQGGYAAAKHLIALGHKRIGVIGSGVDGVLPPDGPGYERIRGLWQAMSEAGCSTDESWYWVGTAPQTTAEMGYQAAMELLRRAPELTAIFAVTDLFAIGVLRAAYDFGLDVPRGLSVIGFDNIPIVSQLIPGLTTIAQPVELMAVKAVDLLLRQITSPSTPPETAIFDTQLVVRESTAVASR